MSLFCSEPSSDLLPQGKSYRLFNGCRTCTSSLPASLLLTPLQPAARLRLPPLPLQGLCYFSRLSHPAWPLTCSIWLLSTLQLCSDVPLLVRPLPAHPVLNNPVPAFCFPRYPIGHAFLLSLPLSVSLPNSILTRRCVLWITDYASRLLSLDHVCSFFVKQGSFWLHLKWIH